MRNVFMLLTMILATETQAATPQALLQQYAEQAKQENAAFSGFSADRGGKFFSSEHLRNGKQTSCATCHTADPRNPGKTRANKVIEPMAPITNPQRFSDEAKVEKWFGRNCQDVLERNCTAQEKGDFIQFLVNVK